jgi:cation:H+ antiporter
MPIAIERLVLVRDLPVMLGAFLMVVVMLIDRQIGRVDGLILLLSLVAYLAYVILHSRQQRRAAAVDLPEVHMSIPKTLGALTAGVVLLAVGGHWLVDAAVVLAASLGMSEAVIGVTVVAIGTSLPEITASLIAVLRGQGSMAIGNVLGSNIWNSLCVLGTSALIIPLDQGQVSATMILAMVISGLLLWVVCRTHHHLSRIEGVLLFAGYVACQWWFITS